MPKGQQLYEDRLLSKEIFTNPLHVTNVILLLEYSFFSPRNYWFNVYYFPFSKTLPFWIGLLQWILLHMH